MAFKDYGVKNNKKEIKYEVVERLGILDSDSPNPKELRVVRWNDGDAKYDLRNWKQNDDGTETPLKGIVLDQEELYSLYEILKEMDDESEE